MFAFLLSLITKATDQKVLPFLAAAIVPVLAYRLIKKPRKNFLLRLLFKRRAKSHMRDTWGGRILLGLLLSVGTGLLIGLFFGWSIGLWVGIGLLVVMFIYFLLGEKPPNPKPGHYYIGNDHKRHWHND